MRVVYPAAKEAFLRGDIDMMADTIRLQLVGAYIYDAADLIISDITGAIGSSVIAAVTDVADGIAQCNDVTFPDVGGTDHVTGIVTFHDNTGTLIAYTDQRADTVPLDVTPNGGDITLSFNYLVKI